MLGEQQRAGGQTQHGQGAQHDRRTGVAGNTQRQQRDKGTARDGVVAALAGRQALGRAVAEFLLVLGPCLGLAVADPGGDIAAGAGHRADEGADDGGADQRGEDPLQIGLGGENMLDFQFVLLRLVALGHLLNGVQSLGEGEQSDQQGDEADAAHQVHRPEGEAVHAAHAVDADGGQQQADDAADDALDDGFSRQACHDADAEYRQRKVLLCAELQGYLSQHRGEDAQADGAEQAAEQRSKGGDAQGTAGLTQLVGHGIAVQSRGSGGRGARGIQQAGGNGAAVNAAAEHAQQHVHAAHAGEAQGKGKKDREAHDCGQARQSADDDACEGSDEHREQVYRQKDILDCTQYIFQSKHLPYSLNRTPWGSLTRRPNLNSAYMAAVAMMPTRMARSHFLSPSTHMTEGMKITDARMKPPKRRTTQYTAKISSIQYTPFISGLLTLMGASLLLR